jgi:hypothetical protein
MPRFFFKKKVEEECQSSDVLKQRIKVQECQSSDALGRDRSLSLSRGECQSHFDHAHCTLAGVLLFAPVCATVA